MIHMDLVEVPNFIPGDYVLRCRSEKFAPEIQAGDWLVLKEQDTADDSALVVVELEDNRVALERYAAGMKIHGLVTGLMRRLDGAS